MWIARISYFFLFSSAGLLSLVAPANCNLNCGFPAIPNHAQIKEFSWNLQGNQTFPPGCQITFQCQSGFYAIPRENATKICSNGSWIGEDIKCYEITTFNAIVFNDSKVYYDVDSFLAKKEFLGKMELVLDRISRIETIEIHFKLRESRLSSYSPWGPEISIGKQNCVADIESLPPTSEIQLLYSCPSKITKGFVVTCSQPTNIQNIAAYSLPESKCTGFPEIPLNALATMNGSRTVHYRCREGFVLQGNERRSCDPESGQWLPEPPSCNMNSEYFAITYSIDYRIIFFLGCFFLSLTLFFIPMYVITKSYLRIKNGNEKKHLNDEKDQSLHLIT